MSKTVSIVHGHDASHQRIAGAWSDQVRFDLTNLQAPDQGPVIYISQTPAKDALWGRLSFQILNDTGSTDPIQLDASSVLRIYLDQILPDHDIAGIAVPPGSPWTGGPVSDALGVHLELRPRGPVMIGAGEVCAIEVINAFGAVVASGPIEFVLTGNFGMGGGKVTGSCPGFVHNRPGNLNRWQLTCNPVARPDYQDAGNAIYVTAAGAPDVVNYVEIVLYHSGDGTLPYSAEARFNILFMTDGDSALCSADELKVVTASTAAQTPGGRWQDPGKDTTKVLTVWSVAPTTLAGDLFPAESSLTLRFDGIVSHLPPSGNATIYLQYSGLPGYDDGYLIVLLARQLPILRVLDFHAEWNGQHIPDEGGVRYRELTLSWNVFGADDCLIGLSGQAGAVVPAKGSINPPMPTAALSYTLVARANGQDYPQEPLTFQMMPPTAAISATFEYTDNNHRFLELGDLPAHYTWTLTLNLSSTGATNWSVSIPGLAVSAASPNSQFVLSGSSDALQDLKWLNNELQCYPTFNVSNAAGSASASCESNVIAHFG